MSVPMLRVEDTLDTLVDRWHKQRSARGSVNPVEVLQEAGVSLGDPGLLEYIGFLQDYEVAIYEQEALPTELNEATPIDWQRVGKHTAGGLAMGAFMGGLYGALLVGGALGSGVLAEEKLESTQTDLRAMYIGAGMGALAGLVLGTPGLVMGLCMYTGIMSSAFYQWDEDSRLTDRIERYQHSSHEGFCERIQQLKQYYVAQITAHNADSE